MAVFEVVIRQAGEETVALRADEAQTRELLAAKHASHLAHGWSVQSANASGFVAIKDYACRARKQREIFIRVSDT